MRVTRVELTDFRSYPALDLAFDAGVSALVGSNGQGKTNVVEAVGYLAALGSHRVASDAPLVRAGAERAVIRAELARDDRRLLLELEINPGRANRARVNRGPVPRAREILGLLRTVLFAPEDLDLVKGDPSVRRRFLDDLLVLRAPRYAAVRADYDRVLKQRNTLLKTAMAARRAGPGGDYRTLEVWDAHLAQFGADLLAGRLDLLAALHPHLVVAHEAVAGAAPVLARYRSSLTELPLPSGAGADRDLLAAALLAELARIRPQEVERGVSLVGPHRDDVDLQLGELPAKGYASHGESWSVALACKLAAYELLRADGGEPVLLLDDVFAELDSRRRARLAELVAAAEQVLVTAAVPEDVPAVLRGARYDVHAGVITRVC